MDIATTASGRNLPPYSPFATQTETHLDGGRQLLSATAQRTANPFAVPLYPTFTPTLLEPIDASCGHSIASSSRPSSIRTTSSCRTFASYFHSPTLSSPSYTTPPPRSPPLPSPPPPPTTDSVFFLPLDSSSVFLLPAYFPVPLPSDSSSCDGLGHGSRGRKSGRSRVRKVGWVLGKVALALVTPPPA